MFLLNISLCSLVSEITSKLVLSFLIPKMVYVPLSPTRILCLCSPVPQFNLSLFSSSLKPLGGPQNDARNVKKGRDAMCPSKTSMKIAALAILFLSTYFLFRLISFLHLRVPLVLRSQIQWVHRLETPDYFCGINLKCRQQLKLPRLLFHFELLEVTLDHPVATGN